MESVIRVSLVAPPLADFAVPVSATSAVTPARHDDLVSTLGKPYCDFYILPSSVWRDWPKNR